MQKSLRDNEFVEVISNDDDEIIANYEFVQDLNDFDSDRKKKI